MSGDAVHEPSSAAFFAELGIAEVQSTPTWLRPSPAAAGHESQLINSSGQPEVLAMAPFRSDSSIKAPAERAHRWAEHWEALEEVLSLLADQPSDGLLEPHDAFFAQASRRGVG